MAARRTGREQQVKRAPFLRTNLQSPQASYWVLMVFETLSWRDVAGDLFLGGCRAIQPKVAWAFSQKFLTLEYGTDLRLAPDRE